jgi:hypothetical protein
MANQTAHDNIDRYLRNEMNSAERNDFETELAQNEELSADLAFVQDTQTALTLQHREALKKKLQAFDEEDVKVISMPVTKPQWQYYAVAASFLLVVGAWFLFQPSANKDTAKTNSTITKDSIPKETQSLMEKPKQEVATTKEKKKENTTTQNLHLPIENIGTENLGIAGTEKEFLDVSIQLSPKDTLQYTWQGDKLLLQHYQKIAKMSIKKVTSSFFSGTYLKIEEKYYRIALGAKQQKLQEEQSKARLKILKS